MYASLLLNGIKLHLGQNGRDGREGVPGLHGAKGWPKFKWNCADQKYSF